MSHAVRALTIRCVDTTVLLVPMTVAQVREWKWVGDAWDGTEPVKGYEVRDITGALLGAILPLGHMATSHHVEWYDPTAGEFFSAGQTPNAILRQGAAYVLQQYTRHVGPAASGEAPGIVSPRYIDDLPRYIGHFPRRRACHWTWCVDPECPDLAPAGTAA